MSDTVEKIVFPSKSCSIIINTLHSRQKEKPLSFSLLIFVLRMIIASCLWGVCVRERRGEERRKGRGEEGRGEMINDKKVPGT